MTIHTADTKRSLPQWLSWLESIHPKEIELGLERVGQVAKDMGLDHFPANIVTIAGTNGKGSCVAALSQLFVAGGQNYGAYTSPHIHCFNERIVINGQPVSDALIIEAFEYINHVRAQIPLTYFEFATLAALYVFKQAGVDYVLLEVGLGGRLDAANIMDADIAIITSIDLDHQEWLGDTRDAIAVEKAGILRHAIPFICVDKAMPDTLHKAAKKNQTRNYFLGDQLQYSSASDAVDFSFITANGDVTTCSVADVYLPLPSVLAALQAFVLVTGNDLPAQTQRLITNMRLPGRYERLKYQNVPWILDVAHNPAAAKLFVEQLKRRGHRDVIALVALMQDKDASGVASALKDVVNVCVCTEISRLPRCRSAASLSTIFASEGIDTYIEENTSDAINNAIILAKERALPIIVAGSFYLVSEIKTQLMSE